MSVSLRSRNQEGYTLVELMITVAVIGVLAAIAIPNFMTYQARTRRSEGMVQVSSIARAYTAFQAEAGTFPDVFTHPDGGFPSLPDTATVGTTKLVWDAAAKKFFDVVGYAPEGNVWHTYEVKSSCGGSALGGGVCSEQTCFTIAAHGDVDGNGVMGAIMYVHPSRDPSGAVIAYCGSDLGGYAVPILPTSGVDVFDEPAVYQTDPY